MILIDFQLLEGSKQKTFLCKNVFLFRNWLWETLKPIVEWDKKKSLVIARAIFASSVADGIKNSCRDNWIAVASCD